jgi:hypothetical protein
MIVISKCLECKHYNINDFDKQSCKAYPNGIPKKIFENKIEHNTPLIGQINDYIFEPKK